MSKTPQARLGIPIGALLHGDCVEEFGDVAGNGGVSENAVHWKVSGRQPLNRMDAAAILVAAPILFRGIPKDPSSPNPIPASSESVAEQKKESPVQKTWVEWFSALLGLHRAVPWSKAKAPLKMI